MQNVQMIFKTNFCYPVKLSYICDSNSDYLLLLNDGKFV